MFIIIKLLLYLLAIMTWVFCLMPPYSLNVTEIEKSLGTGPNFQII
jgi:hypothetical protein